VPTRGSLCNREPLVERNGVPHSRKGGRNTGRRTGSHGTVPPTKSASHFVFPSRRLEVEPEEKVEGGYTGGSVYDMEAIVTKSHRSKYPNPVKFTAGDQLAPGRHDEDYPGWIRITTQDGNEGWAPESLISVHEGGGGATATGDYCARELDTEKGETVSCDREVCGWIWVENQTGKTGWVPVETLRFNPPTKNSVSGGTGG